MNKRITSLLLCFVMVFAMLATAVPAFAVTGKSTYFKMTADKTEASPGDTVTYTAYIGPVDGLAAIKFKLKFPSGLTYVEGSGKAVDGLQSLLNSAKAEFTESTKVFIVGSSNYTSTEDTALMKFQCKVNDDATGSQTVEFYIDDPDNLFDQDYDNIDFTLHNATVNVVAAPKPATSIKLNKSTTTIYTGANETLIATVEPNDTTDTVTWTSSNTAVATVDNTGKVTAVAPGTATITAKAGDKTATCTVTVENAPCTHTSKTPVPAKASTCEEKGWDAYQTCDDCGALFDSTGNPIAEIPYRALNDDHDFDTTTWGYKGADGHAHVCTRNPDHHDAVVPHTSSGPATEDTAETCTVCGYVITPATGHVCASHLTKVEAEAATCTDPGNLEHYKCSCGKLYADLTANVPLTEEDVNRGALGHDWIDATCTEAKTCDRCGETEGTALGHDWEGEWSSNADNHWHACTRCDAKDGEGAHNPGAPATETTPQTCTDCGYVITSATGHVCANHLTKVEAEAATCTEPGNLEHYKCSCGKLYADGTASVELSEEDVVIDALGHDWAEEWSSDATNHWHACTRCTAKKDEGAHNPGAPATETTPQTCIDCGYVIAPATGHVCASHLTKVEAKPATCTDEGVVEHYKCSCGKLYWDDDAFDEITDTDELVIDALGHDWAEEWSSDETNHWHACTRCDATTDLHAHNPDHEGGATVDYPILCTDCGYVMEEQLVEPTPSPKPSEPPKPSEAPKPTQTLKPVQPPQTGDHSHLILWVSLLLVSGAVGTAMVSQKRRKNVK